ncbi:MAG: iron chelate uptake ABC transporter family permease subunit [Chloroflexota bacterium]|nr:iron chelate uptake ABC transporter family permease subunit [Chloroflexota bacterium]
MNLQQETQEVFLLFKAGVLGVIRSNRRSSNVSVVTRLVAASTILGVLWFGTALVSLSLGPFSIPIYHMVSIILEPISLELSSYSHTEELVITQLRLPRIIVGTLVGMALGIAGATMQGLFRNPMADPGIIGVSAGGALGAVAAIALGVSSIFYQALSVFAFLGAVGAAFLVFGIASIGGRFSMATLLLAGVAISAFFSAIVAAIMVLVPSNEALREILFWLTGGLDSRSWEHVRLAAPPILGGSAVIFMLSRDLNLLMLGDDEAKSMGVRVSVIRPVLLATAALITGVAVAVSGTIAFVGLVVPHILRLVVGPDHRLLIPLSAVGGALFMVIADTIARTVVQPAEFRVGIITAFVGAPFFIFLLIRNKQRTTSF